MTSESQTLIVLRRRLARAAALCPRFALGHADLDAMLGGGLMLGRLHEVLAGAPEDGASATGFALMLASRAAGNGQIGWIAQDRRRAGRVHAPGLIELGIDPATILFVDAPDEAAVLKAAADMVRSSGVAAVLIAPAGRAASFDLTASRRLTLAAERAGTTAILLRGARPGAGEPLPTAAASRWRVASAPSIPLEADAPGHPAFTVELLRHRGGVVSPHWRLEWDRDARAFATPLPGGALPLPGIRRLA